MAGPLIPSIGTSIGPETSEMELKKEVEILNATNKDLSTALDAANKTIEAMAWEDAKRTETALPEGGWTDIDALPRFHSLTPKQVESIREVSKEQVLTDEEVERTLRGSR